MMTILQDYAEFEGLHWETGSLRNHLAYRGVTAPHTGAPYSEAMLMGVSGGAVMGYFSFSYKGYDPHVRILTRNTFDPVDTILSRLGVVQNIRHTTKEEKGRANLLDTLQDGLPAIVWADMYSLPYNALPQDEGMWAMFPIVVYGFDPEAGTAWTADRARVPLTVTSEELEFARARVKKVKYRVLTLEPPIPDKLPAAVQQGIQDCIALYTEAPPKGAKDSFGFAAYERWADVLTKPTTRLSWEKEFAPGPKMYAGLTSAFTDIMLFGKDGGAERDLYADFLEEASTVLDNAALREVAQGFRASAEAWNGLARALLPAEVPPFGETRELMLRRHRLFLEQGGAALAEIELIDARLAEIKAAVGDAFPLDQGEVTAMRENLAAHVMEIHGIEKRAITALQEAMEARPSII
jgi:hypothetical protein